jgi:type II secretory pathway pseudopilin PulG
MRIARHMTAFTLIELLVGLLITSIVLSAVATLAFALSVASRDAEDTSRVQTQVRHATLQIGELIRTSQLVCAAPGTDLVLWRADDQQNDRIDVNEIVYVEYDDASDSLKLWEFQVEDSPTVLAALGLPETQPVLTILAQPQTKTALLQAYAAGNQVRRTTLLDTCSDVTFTADHNPPYTRWLAISVELTDNGGVHPYEIEMTLRASATHLLSSDGSTLVSDDD